MDHQITQSNKKFNIKTVSIIIVIMLTAIFLVIKLNKPPGLLLTEIQSEKISFGELNITAKGFGHFFSRSDEVISSKIAGRVEKILLYPGDSVIKGQLIIQLSNTDLDYEFLQQKNSLESLKIQWYEEDLNLDEKSNDLNDEVEQVELELKIKEKTNTSNLKLRKNGIVSEISFLKSESEFELAKLKLKTLKRKIIRLAKKQENQKLVHSKKLDLELSKYNNFASKISFKNITSPINGVIKQINLNKGDEITLGKTLAVIGSKQPDAAKIEFPQYFLDSLTVGMTVNMFYADEHISAQISRVDPKINNNYVTVEVSIPAQSAQSALIDMNITAQIKVRQLTDVYYVHQPSYFNTNDPYLFIINDNKITKTSVVAHPEGNNYLIVTLGVSEDDNILISDHKELENNIELNLSQ